VTVQSGGAVSVPVTSGSVQVSGIIGVSGLIGVQSGEVHVLSGFIDIIPPTSIIINNSGNPLILNNNSGGVNLWSGVAKSVVLKALSTNSGDAYIGGYVAGQMPYSGCGLVLSPSDAVVIDIEELGYVHCFGIASGWIKISYLAIK
jgi:hypothetical protein